MKRIILILFLFLVVSACRTTNELEQYGQHYQKYKDYYSLRKAVELMPATINTKQVIKTLGVPIDNSFDYRFLTDSISPNGCTVGAVFNLNKNGKITQRWVDEICE